MLLQMDRRQAMRRTGMLMSLGVLLGGALAPAAVAQEASSLPAIRLVDARRIELPGVRILSMSPEGGSIAGVRPAVGYADGELCTFDAATLAERACTSVAGLGSTLRLEDVRWSPDGTQLAFTANAFQTFRDGDLWLMDAATGEVTNLDDDGFEGSLPFGDDVADARVTVDVSPAFTPDGLGLSFSRSTFDGSVPVGNDIAIVPLAGGESTNLVTVSDRLGVVYFGMAWTPDGSRLAYSHLEPDPEDPRNGIWTIGGDGTDRHLLAGRLDPELGGPAVAQMSPAGDRLLAWYPVAAMRYSGRYALALVDLTTGQAYPLVVDDPASLVAGITMATFSPDGSALLEVTTNTSPNHQVRIRDLETDAVMPLLPDGIEAAGPPQFGMMPTWATNGTVLLTGGGDLSGATLLTLEGGLADHT
jgi:WD40 repeat protein